MTRRSVSIVAAIVAVSILVVVAIWPRQQPAQTPTTPGGSILPTAVAVNGPTIQPAMLTPRPTPSPTRSPQSTPKDPPPTAPPTPTPTPTPSQPGSPPPSSGGKAPFQRVDNFRESGEWIASIASGGPGFVAVGASQVPHLGPNTGCEGDYDGRIWTSPDGRHWSRQPLDFDKTPLYEVVEFAGDLYAFGRPGDACDVRGDHGYSVWKSADGMAWTLAALDVGAPYGSIFDVVATDSRLVALGWEDRRSQAWLSDDGSNWSVPQVPPSSVASGTSLGDTVVAFDNPDDPVTGLQVDVSYDAGANWQQVFVDLSLEATYDFDAHMAVSNGTLVVAMRACCVHGVDVGFSIATSDGRTWSVSQTLASPADAVVALPNGFMKTDDEGTTQLSRDGIVWFEGPALPRVSGNPRRGDLVASGPLGVLLVPTVAGAGGGHVQFAPVNRLDPASWTTPARIADGR